MMAKKNELKIRKKLDCDLIRDHMNIILTFNPSNLFRIPRAIPKITPKEYISLHDCVALVEVLKPIQHYLSTDSTDSDDGMGSTMKNF